MTARTIAIYCDGGLDNDGKPRHEAVDLGQIANRGAEWYFVLGGAVRSANLHGDGGLALSNRTRVVCECGVDVVFGDSFGSGFRPPINPPVSMILDYLGDVVDAARRGAAPAVSEARARRNTNDAKLDALVESGASRLSLTALVRIVASAS